MTHCRRPCCRIGDRTVVLDRDRSRYFLAPSPDVQQRPTDELFAKISLPLAQRDWVGQTVQWTRSDSEEIPSRLQGVTALARLARLEYRCALSMRRGGIDAGLTMLEDTPRDRPNEPDRTAILRAARNAHLWWSAKDRCLPRSIALAIALRRRGSEARLVVGVALDPFTAHAWVQEGDMVLNDGVDHVRLFTPIVVL